MGLRNTKVCTHCGEEDCDGKIYKILKYDEDEYYHNWRGCKNDDCVENKNGEIYYHWVMGHGIEDWWKLEEVK